MAIDNQTKEESTKKRGRRKKVVDGDKKIMPTVITDAKTINPIQSKNSNVILHLSCSIEEIDNHIRNQWKNTEFSYNPDIPQEIMPFEKTNNKDFHILEDNTKSIHQAVIK